MWIRGFMTAVQLCKWFHLGRCGSFTECMYPEQSVLQCLRSLLGFWKRPSLHQNGLNKHWAPQMPTELPWMWGYPSWPVELLSKGSCGSYSLTMGRVYVTHGLFQLTESQSPFNVLWQMYQDFYSFTTMRKQCKVLLLTLKIEQNVKLKLYQLRLNFCWCKSQISQISKKDQYHKNITTSVQLCVIVLYLFLVLFVSS